MNLCRRRGAWIIDVYAITVTGAVAGIGPTSKQQSQPGGERLVNDAHTAPRPRPVAGKVSSFVAAPAGVPPPVALHSGIGASGNPRITPPVPRPTEGSFGVTSEAALGVTPGAGPSAKDAERPAPGRLYSQGPGKASEPGPLATRPGATPAPGSPPPPQALRPLVDMHFWLGYHTEFGQSIRIVGSDTAFGASFPCQLGSLSLQRSQAWPGFDSKGFPCARRSEEWERFLKGCRIKEAQKLFVNLSR